MERIKAIETVYNGYRFRSRLEARWAVFFDAAGIQYEYEPEGFQLSDGTLYLPDFYLPRFGVFVEIKASRERDDGKAEQFALSGACGGMLICYGQPIDHDIRFVTNYESDSDGGGDYDTDWGDYGAVHFATQRHSEIAEYILIDDPKYQRGFYETNWIYTTDYCPFAELRYYDGGEAELLARQARFEHGETP